MNVAQLVLKVCQLAI